jgi:hypothetical protein
VPQVIAVLMVVVAVASLQVSRPVKGQYRLPAKGFAVDVPREAKGFLEGDAAVERGIRIVLPSGGSVFVYGDMNGSEWRTPAEGVHSVTSVVPVRDNCAAGPISDLKIGQIAGAGARLVCGEDVVRLALAFRPGGGPIYWLRLETTRRREAAETKAFEGIAATFQLIPWE